MSGKRDASTAREAVKALALWAAVALVLVAIFHLFGVVAGEPWHRSQAPGAGQSLQTPNRRTRVPPPFARRPISNRDTFP